MKGLKIIPWFVLLMVLSYAGVVFVEANRTEVVISFGSHQTGPTAVGFVVLTSVLCGMVAAGMMCSAEILLLFVKVGRLRRRLSLFETGKLKPKTEPPSELTTASTEHQDIG